MFRITAVVVLLPLLVLTVPLIFLAAWMRELAADYRVARIDRVDRVGEE
jgi:hypothetical protein